MEYVRARVWIKADEPLQFIKSAHFRTGEVARLELEYEKLLNVCFLCRRMTHDQSQCPFQLKEQVPSKGNRRLGKGETLKGRGKGKEKASEEEIIRKENQSQLSQSKPHSSECPSRARSAKDRLQWTKKDGKRTGGQGQMEWRVKGIAEGSKPEAGKPRSSEDIILSQNKRRRVSGSDEKQAKRLKMGSSESSNQSPSASLFERLGSSGEKIQGQERGSSCEKSKHSPSVFERLGTLSSSSSPQIHEKQSQSNHSALGVAQGSSHSAASAAKSPSLSIQRCDRET